MLNSVDQNPTEIGVFVILSDSKFCLKDLVSAGGFELWDFGTEAGTTIVVAKIPRRR
jgi:hypothetical protein